MHHAAAAAAAAAAAIVVTTTYMRPSATLTTFSSKAKSRNPTQKLFALRWELSRREWCSVTPYSASPGMLKGLLCSSEIVLRVRVTGRARVFERTRFSLEM